MAKTDIKLHDALKAATAVKAWGVAHSSGLILRRAANDAERALVGVWINDATGQVADVDPELYVDADWKVILNKSEPISEEKEAEGKKAQAAKK